MKKQGSKNLSQKGKAQARQPQQKKSKDKIAAVSSGFEWQSIFAVVVTFIAFSPALSAGFVNWDDPVYLTENEQLKTVIWSSIVNIFSSGVSGNYNPLPIFSFAIEKYFFAFNPVVYHLDNLLLHLLCTFLFYILLRMLRLSKTAAMIGALLFGIHPMRVESVAWVTERKDVLYGVFYLGALITYVKYCNASLQQKPRMKLYLITIVLAVLSLFSKVQAVALPLSMVALDFLLGRKWLKPRTLIIEKIPFWLLSLAFGIINVITLKHSIAFSSATSVTGYSLVERLAVGAYSYFIYLAKFIFPWQMLAMYPYPDKLPAIAYACLVVIPMAAIAFIWWAWKNEKKNLLFGWAFFTFNIIFLLQILGAGQGFLADRFTYVAYAGLFFIVGKFYDDVAARNSYRLAVNGVVAAYLIVFSYLTFQQSKTWRNDAALWTHVVKNNPLAIDAWKNLGFYEWKKRTNLDSAIMCYEKALDLEKHLRGPRAVTYNSLGKVYLEKSDNASADEKKKLVLLSEDCYSRSIKIDSTDGLPDKSFTAHVHVNRGVTLASLGRMDEAFKDFDLAIRLNPENKFGWLNRAQYYISVGDLHRGIADLNEAIKIDSANADFIFKRGQCERLTGAFSEALADFNKCIQLNPNNASYYLDRARAYEAMGNHTAAKADAVKASGLGARVEPSLLN